LNNQAVNKILIALTIVYAVLCLLHYFSQRPLWLDEGFVFKNISELTYYHIFHGPLKNSQVFPRFQLSIVKFLSEIFNHHLLALRFISLISMMTAFFLWIKIYRREFKEDVLFLLAVFSFVSAYYMSYYAAELKPYAFDVFSVAAFCTYFSYQKGFESKTPTKTLYLLSALLPFLLLFSYASLFVFWIGAYNFLLLLKRNRELISVFLLNGFVSLLCLTWLYYFDLQHSRNPHIQSYWESYFLCTESVLCFGDTLFEGIKRLSTFWFAHFDVKAFVVMGVIFIPFLLFGLIQYGFGRWKKDNYQIFHADVLTFIMLMELFILGVLRIYPFTGERITLFFAPFIFLMLIKAFDSLKRIAILHKFFLSYFAVYCLFALIHTLGKYLSLYQ